MLEKMIRTITPYLRNVLEGLTGVKVRGQGNKMKGTI
jgi:hypothetical protein